MHRLTTFRRDRSSASSGARPGALRMREPAGLIDSRDASERLSAFVGAELSAADVSMDRLVIAVATDPVHLVVIAGPMTLTSAEGEMAICHAPGTSESLAAVGAWVGLRVEGIRVLPAGGLVIDSGAGRLFVEAGTDFEAWEVRGMDGGLLACLPGGDISLWRPLSTQKTAGH